MGRHEDRNYVVAQLRYNAIQRFATPNVVGKDFAHEAWQWLYEHGNFGTKIPHTELLLYLFGDLKNVLTKPADCKLQSLNVLVELRQLEADDPMPDEVSDEFRPLLEIELTSNFKVTIYLVV